MEKKYTLEWRGMDKQGHITMAITENTISRGVELRQAQEALGEYVLSCVAKNPSGAVKYLRKQFKLLYKTRQK